MTAIKLGLAFAVAFLATVTATAGDCRQAAVGVGNGGCDYEVPVEVAVGNGYVAGGYTRTVAVAKTRTVFVPVRSNGGYGGNVAVRGGYGNVSVGRGFARAGNGGFVRGNGGGVVRGLLGQAATFAGGFFGAQAGGPVGAGIGSIAGQAVGNILSGGR